MQPVCRCQGNLIVITPVGPVRELLPEGYRSESSTVAEEELASDRARPVPVRRQPMPSNEPRAI